MSTCPLCDGVGRKISVTKHGQSGQLKETVDWCLCMKSRIVSNSVNNRILSWLGDYYLPEDQLDSQLNFNPVDLKVNPNFLIKGTSYDAFCMHLKGMVMKYRFIDPIPFIYCCRSIEILHDFYVKQNDGSSQHLAETDKFDLLIMTFDTEEKNDQLKTCMAQVVYIRKCSRKPTWIYMNKPTLSACTMEYSPELEKMMDDFKIITLSDPGVIFKGQNRKLKEDAASFSR